MSKPFDATSKNLIETDPAGWVTYFGCPVPASAVTVENADLSTVTTDADRVIRVSGPEPWILHLEIQSSWEAGFERRLLQYNSLLQHHHKVPVATAVVMLRKSENMPGVQGRFEVRAPVGPDWAFAYQVLRVWERPAAEFLTGPLGLLPLAPLTAARADELPPIVDAMKARADAEADRTTAARLWVSAYVLLGLKFDRAVSDTLFQGVLQMEESVTYQAIIERGMQRGMQQGMQQGQLQEARTLLLRFGRRQLGLPSPQVEAAINAITDLDRLHSLGDRLADVTTWDELLASG